jgi:hypothetical protein
MMGRVEDDGEGGPSGEDENRTVSRLPKPT